MFGRSAIRVRGQVRITRRFGTSLALRDVKQESTSTPTDASGRTPTIAPQKSKTPDPETVLGPKMWRCSNFDKRMLVWVKKFPSKEDVPDKVGLDMYHKAQSQARIKVANIMIAGTLLACIGAIYSGKKEAKAGRSLAKDNLDWHKRINQEHRDSQAAAVDVKTS